MPTTHTRIFTSLATLVLATGVASAQLPLPKLPGPGPGKVKIETIGTSPAGRIASPDRIMVYDFSAGDPRTASELSAALLKQLRKAGQFASPGAAGETAPANTLVVQGYFEQIQQGKKLIRTGVGFGAGASKVRVHVDLVVAGTVVSQFEGTSTSSKRPGAALSMGLGAAPAMAAALAVGADQKQDVKGDVNRLAKQLSKQIVKAMAEFRR